MFTYKVEQVVKVVDGDTVDIIIDLGFSIFSKQRIRVQGIDTAETRTRDLEEKGLGLKAKEFAKEWFSRPGELVVQTFKDEKYGRMLGKFSRNGEDFSETMIKEKLAVEYFGGKKG